MVKRNVWEKIYKDIPLKKIPWRFAPATWFYKLVNDGVVSTGTVLELGCGTGEKAVYLAKKGFRVAALDISQTAIKHAHKLAKKERVKVDFYAKDATDLSFLRNRKFDFVLDFANLHGIVRSKQQTYAREIVKHTKAGGLFFLRCFSKRTPNRNKDYFIDQIVGDWKVWYFSEEDILTLFGKDFKIVKKHKEDYKTSVMDIYFDEYLMGRR